MKIKTISIVLFFFFALLSKLIFAQPPALPPMKEWLKEFIDFFGLEWLTKDQIRLGIVSRIFVWIIVFTIFYEVLTHVFKEKILRKRASVVISVAIATIAAIFIPVLALLAIGGLYGLIVALALAILPAILCVWLVTAVKPKDPTSRFIRFLISFIFWWIFSIFASSLVFEPHQGIATFVSFAIFIFMLYNLFLWIFGLGEKEEYAAEVGSDFGRHIANKIADALGAKTGAAYRVITGQVEKEDIKSGIQKQLRHLQRLEGKVKDFSDEFSKKNYDQAFKNLDLDDQEKIISIVKDEIAKLLHMTKLKNLEMAAEYLSNGVNAFKNKKNEVISFLKEASDIENKISKGETVSTEEHRKLEKSKNTYLRILEKIISNLDNAFKALD